MKRLAFILAVLFEFTVITSSSPSYITVPPDVSVYLVPCSELCDGTTIQLAPPVLVTVVPPIASTGPVKMKATDGVNCYNIPYMNPNGTCGPTTWNNCL